MIKHTSTHSKYFIGLMSGTSLDGVDAVLVEFSKDQINLVASHNHSIPENLRSLLLHCTQPNWKGSLVEIGTLSQRLGHLFADASNTLINKSNFDKNQITAIGSHGQTLWHQPLDDFPFSMQLGDANIIAEKTGISTVADFRNRDIAAGGQGAPLVPAFHKSLFADKTKHRVLLNIGGIANITVLPSDDNLSEKTLGYDTGPGNGLIDAWVSKHPNVTSAKNGVWGRSGDIIPTVLRLLLEDRYFDLPPPKSTGKEVFNLSWLETRLGDLITQYKPEDIQATLTELTAKSIANEIKQNAPKSEELFVCGGGIHNSFLQERLKHHLPDIAIESSKALGVDPDWMEAIAFAWLAKRTIDGKSANLPSVTGANGYRVLGAVYSQ